jgi:FtsP/CotA-like multicopper oxidase with cupredoxin domain
MSVARPLNRRELLARSGAVAGGAVLLGSGAFGASRLLAAEPSGTFFEPAVRRARNGRLHTRLLVSEAEVPIALRPARSRVYESSFPGPTLEVRPGDLLAVDLVNHSDQPTNLHTHGLHVSPRQPGDDVLLNIKPGETYKYRYKLPKDHPAGTYWYHAHRHMLSDNQVFGGLFGMLVIRGDYDELPGVRGLQEHALVMDQMQIVDGKVVDGADSPLSEQVTLVNGRYQPAIGMTTGETQRWRLVNTSSIFLRVQLDGHPLHVLAIDGNTLTKPMTTDVVALPPGGRADVLVRAPQAGTFALRSLSWDDLGVFWTSMVPVPQVLTTLVVSGTTTAKPAPLPRRLLPVDDLRHVKVDRRREFRLEEREPRGAGLPNDKYQYFIDGRVFDPNRIMVQVPLNSTEEWTFRNLTYEPHPLHIHVNPFQIVAVDGDRGKAESFYRDSAIVPPFGSVTIRHRFLNYTGLYVMHCHILFHEDHGMMAVIEVYGRNGPGPRRLSTTAMPVDPSDPMHMTPGS